MAGEVPGVQCVLQIGVGSPPTYATLEGQTDTTFDGSTNLADTTAKDNAGWQTSLPTVRSGQVTASGTLRSTRPLLTALQAAWVAGTTVQTRILFDGTNGYDALRYVGQFNVTAPTQDAVRYNVTLPLAEAPTVATVTP